MTPPIIVGDALAIGVGAFFGAMSRHQAGKLAEGWISSDPQRLGHLTGWHTAAINVGGSFILGGVAGTPVVMDAAAKPSSPTIPWGLTPRQKLLLGVGFCGSFTTFSTYSTDVVTWVMKGDSSKAAVYVLANNFGGILAAASGLMVARKLIGKL